MFLHTPTLKKLFKKAFNTYGLTVANCNERLCLLGSSWAVSLDINYVPNKVKGAIIELCGELPKTRQAFKATKEGLQYEMPWNEMYDLHKMYMDACLPLTETPVILDEKWNMYKLFQLNKNKEFKAINTELLNVIDIREIDQSIEGMPAGPCCAKENSSMLLWNNATCTLGLCISELNKDKDVELMELLTKIDFFKGDKE